MVLREEIRAEREVGCCFSGELVREDVRLILWIDVVLWRDSSVDGYYEISTIMQASLSVIFTI